MISSRKLIDVPALLGNDECMTNTSLIGSGIAGQQLLGSSGSPP